MVLRREDTLLYCTIIEAQLHIHLELGRQWKIIVFYTFCVKGRVRIFNTKNLYGNDT
jgi:hypothetical protein